MLRTSWAFFLGVLLAVPGGAWAADKGPVGTYKLTILAPTQELTLYLIKMDNKGGKWLVTVVSSDENAPEATNVTAVSIKGGRLRFILKVQRQGNDGRPQTASWSFEGQAPKAKEKNIYGSLSLGPKQLFPVRLEPTTLQKLDRFALDKEALAREGNSYKACLTVLALVRQAKAQKVKSEEIQTWADKAFKIAERFGPRFQHFVAQSVVDGLEAQDIAPAVLLDYAKKAVDLMDPSEDVAKQQEALERVIALLKKAKKETEVKKYQARLAMLADQGYDNYLKKMLDYKRATYKGRKSKSTRVVLVELFTCAQNPEAIPADLAFDGLGKTFPTTDVVLLEYHLNMPAPDALSNPASWARRKYYVDDLEETPSAFFNGKYAAPGGGEFADASEKYRQYREVIEPLLEKATKVKLTAVAIRSGDKVDIIAEVSGLEKPGDKIRLHLALVEEVVKYTGRNQLQYHHHVVRALPGGADGVALTKSSGKQSASVDLKKLRQELNLYLDNYANKKKPFPSDQRPMDLAKLRVVAFLQNDATREVLQAVEVKLGKK
jgi:hypothetical protein